MGLTAVVLVWGSANAQAANILFVSDSSTDTNIPVVLIGDGHTVTTVLNDYRAGSNPTLTRDLSTYDVIFWSATGTGSGSTHTDATVFTNLTSFVMTGGKVFVTGYDAIASPVDSLLYAFIGCTGAADGGARLGPIVATPTSVTTGRVNLVGRVPADASVNQDSCTAVGPGTINLAPGTGSNAGWTLRTLGAGEVAYVSNGDSSPSMHPSWGTTAGDGTGAYNGAIRNFAASALRADPGAPTIEFTGPETALDEGTEVTVTVAVADPEGDMFNYSWDLDNDGTFGELPDIPTFTLPAGMLDGPGGILVAVQAIDSGMRESIRLFAVRANNVAPSIDSEPSLIASVGSPYIYEVVVNDPAGPNDPPTFDLLQAPERMVISDTGVLSWTPNEREITVGSETIPVEVLVDDGDGGEATQQWQLTVSPNRAPTPPAPIFPIGAILIDDARPRLVAANAQDEDFEDELIYFFELDTVDTFDSPAKVESGAVEQTTGFSFWFVPEDLAPRVYHWRVWVSDGTVETEPVTATFEVVEEQVMMVGGDAGDAGADAAPDATPMPPSDDSGCATAPGPSEGFVLLLSLLFAVRRRR
ncbi:MAG: hypothetical protein AAGF12_33275 [Myxococcota bacterium]